MHKINEIIDNTCNRLLNEQNITKESLYDNIKSLNELVMGKLDNIDVDDTMFDKFIVKTNDEKIQGLDMKLSRLKNTPEMLTEAVSLANDKIKLFLKKYNIGFLKSLTLNNSGRFLVEIPCLIMKHNSFHDKDYSANLEFEYQIDMLKQIGLDIEQSNLSSNKGPVILATEKSIDVLTKLITDIGGMGLNYEVRVFKGQKTIRSISFRIDPEKLYEFNEKPFEVVCKTSEYLNPDETLYLIYNFKELKSTFACYNDKDMEKSKVHCKNIILHSFATICDTVGYTTNISQTVNEKYQKVKEENTIIKQKEDAIKAKINPSAIKGFTDTIMSILESFAHEQMGFVCQDVEVSSVLRASFIFNTCGDPYCVYNDDIISMSENDLKDTFECSEGSFDCEDLLILNTQQNIEKLNMIINTKFKNAHIDSIEVEHKNFVGYYIRKIVVVFPTLDMFVSNVEKWKNICLEAENVASEVLNSDEAKAELSINEARDLLRYFGDDEFVEINDQYEFVVKE